MRLFTCKRPFTDYYNYYRVEHSFGFVSIETTFSVFLLSLFSAYHRWHSDILYCLLIMDYN